MYGDYEAQRHWQEITANLPLSEWYTHDLQYWGLDYPPLTAYHSHYLGTVSLASSSDNLFFVGEIKISRQIAEAINASWVALGSSRGEESPEHKLFMRSTVLAVDAPLYLPVAFAVVRRLKGLYGGSDRSAVVGFALLALYPGLIAIDNGHFQYNNASLGLFLAALGFLFYGNACLTTVVFCLALNYKQMELYHALPFFSYYCGLFLSGNQ